MKKRFLLIADFLGFSAKILNQDLQSSIEYYTNLLRYFTIPSNHFPDLVQFQLISDSMCIWIDSEDESLQLESICHIAGLLLHNSLLSESFIRGAIVFDEFIIENINLPLWKLKDGKTQDQKIFAILGKAIIRAFKWEQNQNWLGISIEPSLNTFIRQSLNKSLSYLESTNRLLLYPVETKDKNKPMAFCINPVVKGHIDAIKNNLISTQVIQEDINIKIKIQNTIDFVNYIARENHTCELTKIPLSLIKHRINH